MFHDEINNIGKCSININGANLTNLRFVDDVVLLFRITGGVEKDVV